MWKGTERETSQPLKAATVLLEEIHEIPKVLITIASISLKKEKNLQNGSFFIRKGFLYSDIATVKAGNVVTFLAQNNFFLRISCR
jgi:hypothetical protein